MNARSVAAVASDRQTPYLRHGKPVDAGATVEEALRQAGLDWEVEKVPTYDLVDGRPVQVEGRYNVRRADTKRVFDVVGTGYQEVNNLDALAVGDELHQVGGAKFVAAGETAGGKGVWLAFELPEMGIDLGGDGYGMTGLLETAHTGKRAVRMHVAPVRFKCTNVTNLLLRSAVRRWSVHHNSKAEDRLREAATAVGLIEEYRQAFVETGDKLLHKEMSGRQLDSFLAKVVPDRPKKEQEVAAIRQLAAEAETNEFGRGTAYAALNAVREYYDHVRPQRTTESAFIGAYTGVNVRQTDRALGLLLG